MSTKKKSKTASVIGLVTLTNHDSPAEVALSLPKNGRHLVFTFKSLGKDAKLKRLENLSAEERDRYGKSDDFECVVVGGSIWTATPKKDPKYGYSQQDLVMAGADGVYIARLAQRHGIEIGNAQQIQYVGVPLDRLNEMQLETLTAIKSVLVKTETEAKAEGQA